ncbi:hypothetical protein [Oceanobacillus neutriphilus]|uniref:Serine/threonine protein phosphatase n=1 Tax=Oceanobacillus neutriphilus TaxID=531815 RepID=A0ABQ2NS79_9BACI|nr:hypothetical protein [Oceanobacillus neutriphilus]GGP08576.1 hypothetical protein GCM10011346_09170 [Oceanobacillus neutriphilus]
MTMIYAISDIHGCYEAMLDTLNMEVCNRTARIYMEIPGGNKFIL